MAARVAIMPIIDVTYGPGVDATARRALADVLPESVSEAVACPEEPYDGALRGGDVILRFRPASAEDRFELDVLIEVHSKWFASRAVDRQRRADDIHRDSAAVLPAGSHIGVYLRLPVAAWSETEEDPPST